MDPLQRPMIGPWPELEEDEAVALPAPRGTAPYTSTPTIKIDQPIAWPVTATTALVREIRQSNGSTTTSPRSSPAAQQIGVKTYSPFGRK